MKRYILYAIIPVLAFTALSPFQVDADTVSELRQQLREVLNRIEKLKEELRLIESGIMPTVSGKASCVTIERNLSKGDQNDEVKKLQLFLAQDKSVYPEGIISGYYGALTESAVQRWQSKHGIISYGDPASTGYGVVGPKTREAMKNACEQRAETVEGVSNVINFEFEKSSGQAPFEAVAKITMLEASCMSYQIDWGDGSEPVTYISPQTENCEGGVKTVQVKHTYKLSGEYTATLFAGKSNLASELMKVTTAKVSVSAGNPFVKVLYPNGGETLRLGDNTKIKWQVANYPQDSAVVFYIVGPTGTYRFARRSHRSQEFNWIVGDRVCDGNGCNVQLPVGPGYKIRAALYTPATACIDFCNAESVLPTFLATDDSDDTFSLGQLSDSGSGPLQIVKNTGKAPFTTSINISIAPVSEGIGNFEVDYGDGTQPYRIHIPAGETRITKRSISHTYANSGTYSIQLRPVGAVQHIAEQKVFVQDSEFRVVPKTRALAPVTAKAYFMVDESCSYMEDITRIYTVDWGDNTETSRYEKTIPRCTDEESSKQKLVEKSFTHAYTRPGTYRPKLITTVNQTFNSKVTSISVENPTLSVSPSFGFKPLTTKARFVADESCVMGDPTTVTYSIDWGDGTAKSEYSKTLPSCNGVFTVNKIDKEFEHTYQEIGRYTVTLTVSKGNIGESYSRTAEIVVDKSVLRNGVRKLVQMLNESDVKNNVATAIYSFKHLTQ